MTDEEAGLIERTSVGFTPAEMAALRRFAKGQCSSVARLIRIAVLQLMDKDGSPPVPPPMSRR